MYTMKKISFPSYSLNSMFHWPFPMDNYIFIFPQMTVYIQANKKIYFLSSPFIYALYIY